MFLDDYHLVTYAQVHQALAFMLRHGPENLHVVVLTRETMEQYLGKLPATLRPISSLFADLIEGLPRHQMAFLEGI